MLLIYLYLRYFCLTSENIRRSTWRLYSSTLIFSKEGVIGREGLETNGLGGEWLGFSPDNESLLEYFNVFSAAISLKIGWRIRWSIVILLTGLITNIFMNMSYNISLLLSTNLEYLKGRHLVCTSSSFLIESHEKGYIEFSM